MLPRALFLIVAAFCASPVSAQPPLPRLALTTYPTAARDAIARAHADAIAHATDADATGKLGRVLHAWEQWEAAHQAYTRAQALAPRAFEWHYLDALVLQRLARHAEAVDQLNAALGVKADYAPARLKLAESLFETGQLEESKRLFTAITEPACEPAVEFGLGRITAAQGQPDQAIAHLQRAVELYPEFAAAYYALAMAYRGAGRTEDAKAALARHAQYGARWPAVPDPVFASVSSLREDAGAVLQRGVKLADAGDVNGAIAAHEAALAMDPSLVQAHQNLISLYSRAGQLEKAEAEYRAVHAANVNVADVEYDYGVALGMQQKWEPAADAYRRAIALNPLHAQAHNNLGQILERQRNIEEALAEYRRAVSASPTLRLARFNEGRMLIALGRNDEAVATLEQITEPRDAEAPRYLFALSAAQLRAGRRKEALEWAEAARALAVKYGDTALAAAIEREVASIK